MKRFPRWTALLAAVLLLTGCATAPRPTTAPVAPPAWLAAPAVWRIRQVVLIEFGEAKTPIQGLLELDTAAGTVRLAALDDFGVTLFRLSVTRAGEHIDFILPLVPRGAEVTHAVATSLRRVYLEPGVVVPGGGAAVLEAAPDGTVASANAPGGNWKVFYDDYRNENNVPVPHRIRYQERGGVSLTIRQESVKRVER